MFVMPEEKNIHHTMPYQAKTLQLLIENARDYAIVMMDTEGRIVLWNTGAENVLGWQEAEIVGQPAAVFFTPEDRAAGAPEQEFRTAREQGRAEDERWHIRKDGSRFWGSGLVQPIPAMMGTLQGYTKIFRDLTEQRRARKPCASSGSACKPLSMPQRSEPGWWMPPPTASSGDATLRGFFGLTEARGGERYARNLPQPHPPRRRSRCRCRAPTFHDDGREV